MQQPAPAAIPNSWAVRSSQDALSIKRLKTEDVCWDVHAPGPTHGMILVERLRTFSGNLLDLSHHRNRLRIGIKACSWDESIAIQTFDLACQELLDANRNQLSSMDLSLIFLVNPARNGWELTGYVSPLPRDRLTHWYKHGTSLFSTSYRVIPNRIFPTSIKHRSRIHYWLADQQVASKALYSLALLESDNGFVGDTSVANVVVVTTDGRWYTPSLEYAHVGTTLLKCRELLGSAGVEMETKDIRLPDLLAAQEVILVGSTGVAWTATSLNGQPLGDANRKHTVQLQTLWKTYTGMDFLL